MPMIRAVVIGCGSSFRNSVVSDFTGCQVLQHKVRSVRHTWVVL